MKITWALGFFLCAVAPNCCYGGESAYLEKCFSVFDEKKEQAFIQDPFFRVSLEVFRESIDDFEAFFKNYTYLVVKPDAIVAGKFSRILEVLIEEGFDVAGFTLFEYTPASIKQCWYEESRFFPPEWCKLFEMILTGKTSVLLLLQDKKNNQGNLYRNYVKIREYAKPTQAGTDSSGSFGISACERLSRLKGSALASKRESWHIRTKIGAGDGTFGYIHAPDSPLAMIRELGILISEKQTRDLLTKRSSLDVRYLAQELRTLDQRLTPRNPHDLDEKKAKERLRSVVLELPSSLQKPCLQFFEDETLSWMDFVRWQEEKGLAFPEWDLITFCVSRRAWQ